MDDQPTPPSGDAASTSPGDTAADPAHSGDTTRDAIDREVERQRDVITGKTDATAPPADSAARHSGTSVARSVAGGAAQSAATTAASAVGGLTAAAGGSMFGDDRPTPGPQHDVDVALGSSRVGGGLDTGFGDDSGVLGASAGIEGSEVGMRGGVEAGGRLDDHGASGVVGGGYEGRVGGIRGGATGYLGADIDEHGVRTGSSDEAHLRGMEIGGVGVHQAEAHHSHTLGVTDDGVQVSERTGASADTTIGSGSFEGGYEAGAGLSGAHAAGDASGSYADPFGLGTWSGSEQGEISIGEGGVAHGEFGHAAGFESELGRGQGSGSGDVTVGWDGASAATAAATEASVDVGALGDLTGSFEGSEAASIGLDGLHLGSSNHAGVDLAGIDLGVGQHTTVDIGADHAGVDVGADTPFGGFGGHADLSTDPAELGAGVEVFGVDVGVDGGDVANTATDVVDTAGGVVEDAGDAVGGVVDDIGDLF